MIEFVCLGVGWVAQEIWLPLFEQTGLFKCIGIYDPNQNKTTVLSKKYFIADSPEQLIELKPQLTIIATPNHLHASYAIAFLQENCSVFIEKPTVINEQDFNNLAMAAKKSRGHLLTSHASRYRTDCQKIKAFINENKLGTIWQAEFKWLRAKGIPKPGSWFTQRQFSGGGVSFDLGWHLFDLGLYLFSFPQIIHQSAIKSQTTSKELAELSTAWRQDTEQAIDYTMDVDDQFYSFVKTNSALALSFQAAWLSHESVDQTFININGENGCLELLTTFGFSPNRVQQPQLILKQRGQQQIIYADKEDNFQPYRKQVQEVYEQLQQPINNENVLAEIASVLNLAVGVAKS